MAMIIIICNWYNSNQALFNPLYPSDSIIESSLNSVIIGLGNDGSLPDRIKTYHQFDTQKKLNNLKECSRVFTILNAFKNVTFKIAAILSLLRPQCTNCKDVPQSFTQGQKGHPKHLSSGTIDFHNASKATSICRAFSSASSCIIQINSHGIYSRSNEPALIIQLSEKTKQETKFQTITLFSSFMTLGLLVVGAQMHSVNSGLPDGPSQFIKHIIKAVIIDTLWLGNTRYLPWGECYCLRCIITHLSRVVKM